MAKFILLIYGDEREWAAMSPEQSRKHDAGHVAFTAAAGSRIIGAAELTPAPEAITVRADPADQILRTDGPFAETKEAVGGYYLLDCADVEEVIALASHLPEVHAGHSGIEIRAVVEH